jgi:hypothetical protein
MDEEELIPVSPRHSVRLADEYLALVRKAPRRDFVVRTITKREANGLPLMSAEIVIAGQETRAEFPLAATYPLHFRKSYFPGRLHGDPKLEFDCQARASELIGVPPPIGFGPQTFRACLLPGPTYSSLTPLQAEPDEANLPHARELGLAAAAGLWKLAEQAHDQLLSLHRGGLSHGDAELHNFVVCSTPLEIVVIDFEDAAEKSALSAHEWEARCRKDLDPLLKHAVLLECCLGSQPGPLGDMAWEALERLFKNPERFRRAIGRQQDLRG